MGDGAKGVSNVGNWDFLITFEIDDKNGSKYLPDGNWIQPEGISPYGIPYGDGDIKMDTPGRDIWWDNASLARIIATMGRKNTFSAKFRPGPKTYKLKDNII